MSIIAVAIVANARTMSIAGTSLRPVGISRSVDVGARVDGHRGAGGAPHAAQVHVCNGHVLAPHTLGTPHKEPRCSRVKQLSSMYPIGPVESPRLYHHAIAISTEAMLYVRNSGYGPMLRSRTTLTPTLVTSNVAASHGDQYLCRDVNIYLA